MKTRELKNRLNKEIDTMYVPDVLGNVVANSKIEGKTKKEKKTAFSLNWKKATVALATCAVLIFSIIGIVFLANRQTDIGGGVVANSTYMTLDINPSVSFIADSNRKITSVRAENADAEAVLSQIDGGLIGKSLEDGMESFVDTAARLGFINLEATTEAPDIIRLSTITENETSDAQNIVQAKLQAYFGNKGLYTLVYTASISKNELVQLAQTVDASADLSKDISHLTALLANRRSILEEKYADFCNNYSSSEALKAVYLYTLLEEKFDEFFAYANAMTALDVANQAVIEKSKLSLYDGFYFLNKTTLDPELGKAVADFKKAYRNCLYVFGLEDKTLSEVYLKTNLAIYANISEEALQLYRDKADEVLLKIKTKAEAIDAVLAKIQTEFSAILSLIPDLVEGLEKIPASLNEMLSAHAQSIKLNAEDRANSYLDIYNIKREQLNNSDFDKISEDIIQHYGSLKNYYDIIKEKNN